MMSRSGELSKNSFAVMRHRPTASHRHVRLLLRSVIKVLSANVERLTVIDAVHRPGTDGDVVTPTGLRQTVTGVSSRFSRTVRLQPVTVRGESLRLARHELPQIGQECFKLRVGQYAGQRMMRFRINALPDHDL